MKDAIDEIDAAVFTGDTLYDKEILKDFEWHLDRWSREIAKIKATGLEIEEIECDTRINSNVSNCQQYNSL